MKNIYLTTLAIFIGLSTFAQSTSFGVKAGLISSSIKGDANQSLQSVLDFTNGMVTSASRTGFYGGAFVNIPLGKGFILEPGLNYAQKGYELNGEFEIKGAEFIGANAKAKLQTDYIDLPLLLKADMAGLQIFAGPQISYLMNAKVKTTAGALGFDILNKTFDVTNQYNRVDAALMGGVGYQFKNGLGLSAAYEHGLKKLDKNNNLAAYNRTFKVGLSLSL